MALHHSTMELSLKQVSANFEQWRATRTKKSKIPNELWEQVMPLFKKYSKSKISRALSLSGRQIYDKTKSVHNNIVKMPPPKMATFVPISIPPIIEAAESNILGKLELKRADGAVISIEGLNQKIFTQILRQFMEGLSC